MTARKAAGEKVDESDIDKHKKDVFRMAALLNPGNPVTLPEKLSHDIRVFVTIISDDLPGKELFRAMKTPSLNAESLLERIAEVFSL